MDAFVRELVRDRARHRCEYCRAAQEFSELRFHIEHVVPRQHGGGDDAENFALACPDCNLHKDPNLTGIDPNTGAVAGLFIHAGKLGPSILNTSTLASWAGLPSAGPPPGCSK